MKDENSGLSEGASVLSLGMGVQSTALYLMSALGELPRIDYAVFSDTGREMTGTMEYLEWLINWKDKNNGPEIIVKKQKNLFTDLLSSVNSAGRRFASIPAFTTSINRAEGLLRRQCTYQYKIQVVDQAIRDMYGLRKHQRNIKTTIWKGISADEATRMSIPETPWKTFVYPFVGYGIPGVGKWFKLDSLTHKTMNRNDIKSWYKKHGFLVPPKSSCVFCPYHSDHTWSDMKENYPEDFEDAVRVDKAIRDSSQRGVEQQIFLHRSLKPLDEVAFDPDSRIEFGECSGTCHN